MAHEFVTDGQLSYIRSFCDLVVDAMYGEEDGEKAIDMDAIADQATKGVDMPPFYYVEESQQNNYECDSCGDQNDILGRYGYCSCCGTHNGFQELKRELNTIQIRVETGSQYESCVKDAVAAFDSYARQISKQLVQRIPMTSRRKNEWHRKLFHNLALRAKDLDQVFDIDILNGLSKGDIAFGTLMFHRRHIYEHNGGEVDEKYLADSGDKQVRLKQVLRENKQSVSRILKFVEKISSNLNSGFHRIFPREDGAPEKAT